MCPLSLLVHCCRCANCRQLLTPFGGCLEYLGAATIRGQQWTTHLRFQVSTNTVRVFDEGRMVSHSLDLAKTSLGHHTAIQHACTVSLLWSKSKSLSAIKLKLLFSCNFIKHVTGLSRYLCPASWWLCLPFKPKKLLAGLT
jgi:hypothetical protein